MYNKLERLVLRVLWIQIRHDIYHICIHF